MFFNNREIRWGINKHPRWYFSNYSLCNLHWLHIHLVTYQLKKPSFVTHLFMCNGLPFQQCIPPGLIGSAQYSARFRSKCSDSYTFAQEIYGIHHGLQRYTYLICLYTISVILNAWLCTLKLLYQDLCARHITVSNHIPSLCEPHFIFDLLKRNDRQQLNQYVMQLITSSCGQDEHSRVGE